MKTTTSNATNDSDVSHRFSNQLFGIELAGYTQGYCAQLISLERGGNQKIVKANWKEVSAMNDTVAV